MAHFTTLANELLKARIRFFKEPMKNTRTEPMQPLDFMNMVADFHRTFKHPIQRSPTIPDKKRCALRIALIAEEVKELETAVHNKDLVEIADALCDIQYVLCGAVLEFGLQEKFDALFSEVQRSNMSKACHTEEEALETVRYYREKKGVECYFVREGDTWLIYRKSDQKTMKSIHYSPADIAKILHD